MVAVGWWLLSAGWGSLQVLVCTGGRVPQVCTSVCTTANLHSASAQPCTPPFPVPANPHPGAEGPHTHPGSLLRVAMLQGSGSMWGGSAEEGALAASCQGRLLYGSMSSSSLKWVGGRMSPSAGLLGSASPGFLTLRDKDLRGTIKSIRLAANWGIVGCSSPGLHSRGTGEAGTEQ